jgi:hypothetical protein
VLDGLDNAVRCSSGLLDGRTPSTPDYIGAGSCFASWLLGELLESASPDQLAAVGRAVEDAALAQAAYEDDPTDEQAQIAADELAMAEALARALTE